MSDLFTSVRVGPYSLANRLAMAPMTRSRANTDGTPTPLMAEYYAQRASLGLILTEATQPSDIGQGNVNTPGIYTAAHVKGWEQVTSAIHAKGGRVFIQIMHVGRMSHPENVVGNLQAVAPSALAPNLQLHTPSGMKEVPVPREMTLQDIKQTVADFRHAARSAIEAGADGVEVHGANGYLIQQFLAPNANVRTDEYGGSIPNRARFAIEVVSAVVEEIGAERTGFRVSPGGPLGDLDEGSEGPALYRYLVGELDKLGLAFLDVMHWGNEELLKDIRNLWHQTLILNRPGRPRELIGADVAAGLADIESYGSMTLANPDFARRTQTKAPLNEVDKATFFGGSARGYTDYPSLA
ncbi:MULTISPECIES: alkene reductase [Rhizobium/Agrobacterium group]|uniref:alkene reductase n=1 Tax=Rhizobium/Agrobacterium group TaxID=227290 RepID=UPI0007126270|nr:MULTISPECIES: alkene reductase [Rhizobium/Agrobacterium group]KQV36381.1 1,2-oxophytodienoate reductase [Rhizobium sp. Root1204]